MIYIKKASKRFVSILLLLSLLLFFCSCSWSWEEYAKSTSWCCTKEEFTANYLPLYLNKIEQLKEFYGVECVLQTDIQRYDYFHIYLYNNFFTIEISFMNELSSNIEKENWNYGSIWATLYFYGENGLISDYNAQKVYVDFLNDFVNYSAFDAKTNENRFASLFAECVQQEEPSKSDTYHFDQLIGYVGYNVTTNSELNGHYYMMEKDTALQKISNSFSFEGLLKPLY